MESRLQLVARQCIYWSPSYFSPLQNFWPTWYPWPAHPDVEESRTGLDEWWTPAGWSPGGWRSLPRRATASQDDRDRQSRHTPPTQTPHASLWSTCEWEITIFQPKKIWCIKFCFGFNNNNFSCNNNNKSQSDYKIKIETEQFQHFALGPLGLLISSVKRYIFDTKLKDTSVSARSW